MSVAGRIKDELRLSDTMGRFGGEEFVAVLVNAELDAAAMVAERIRGSVAGTPVELLGGAALPVSVSIGVAVLDDFEREHAIEDVAQALLAQADSALYKAKEGGRNRVVAYEAPDPA